MAVCSKLGQAMIRVLLVVGGIALMVMMTIIVGNCLGRTLFRRPIFGTIEFAGLAGVVVVAAAIGFTEKERRNVVVDVVASRFTPRGRALADFFTLFLSLGAVAFLFWAIVNDALNALTMQEATFTTGVVTAPFKFAWALGIIILLLFLLQHMLEAIKKGMRR